ncbi:MAG: adenylosuccinate lyase [Bacillota bacterium]
MIPRYTLPEMGRLWTDEHRFETWRRVEVACMRAWARLGVIPTGAAEEVEEKTRIDPARIDELEAEIRHDVIAFVTSLAEQVGEASRHIHYGLTSSDVLDTALGLQLKEAGEILLRDVDGVTDALAEAAVKYRDVPMIGRTHGIHAEPITFGLKLALWFEEMGRARDRLERAIAEVSYGKISGATGTYAQVPPQVEEMVCRELGLQPAPVSSQILGRDRHAALLTQLAMVGSLLEKYATEIRHLQRTEVGEVEEPFRSGQKGSSAMPHKRNPIVTERLSGMARLLRGHASTAMENVALWHERDISHSSVERVIIPDSTILVDYMLQRFAVVIRDMRVYPERMRENLEMTGGLVFSQRVLLALVGAGMGREEAYSAVQETAMRAFETEEPFRRLIGRDRRVTERISAEDLERCFDLEEQLVWVDTVFERLGLM